MADELRKTRSWTQEWNSPSGREKVSLELDEVRVQHFRNLNRVIGEAGNWPGCYYSQYASFWIWRGGHPEIQSVVNQLRDQYSKQHGANPKLDRDYASFIKQFSGTFPYQYDDRSIGHLEYAKFPIEFLYDKEGDCECSAFFLASLYAHAGFDVGILIGYTKPRHRGAHAATGLLIPTEDGDDMVRAHGRDYVYCEAVSSNPVGKCAFDFDIFARDADVWRISPNYKWEGRPRAWNCPQGCGDVEPWIERCPSCGATAVLSDTQQAGDDAADWERILVDFVTYIDWIRDAPLVELGRELEKVSRGSIWDHVPSGNRTYFEKTVKSMNGEDHEAAKHYLEGARNHLLSAWPHIVASVFCHAPQPGTANDKVDKPLSWLGMSVYDMDNETLALFARKILSDTTCKRIKGFSSGSRLGIGRILSTFEQHGDPYMDEKRKSIENILVKVVIPQAFTLLTREHLGKSDP